jgi:hypothetical protein
MKLALKQIRMSGCGLNSTDSGCQVVGFCEHCNERQGSTKGSLSTKPTPDSQGLCSMAVEANNIYTETIISSLSLLIIGY